MLGMDAETASVSQVYASQLRKLRTQQGLQQQDLAARLEERFGVKLDASTLSRIEAGKRRLTLEEALVLAAALEVAPVQLAAPMDGSDVKLGNVTLSASRLRAFVRGRQPLPGGNDRLFTSQVADHEWQSQRLEDLEQLTLASQREAADYRDMLAKTDARLADAEERGDAEEAENQRRIRSVLASELAEAEAEAARRAEQLEHLRAEVEE